MISTENLEKLSKQYQTSLFPNIIREYFQHIFLSELYKLPDSDKLLFKGGTALRIIYGSPRFSEDLDFSLFNMSPSETKSSIEGLFIKALAQIEKFGIKVDIGAKSDVTSGGYFGIATFKMFDYEPVDIEINISERNGRDIKGEIDSIINDFTPAYNIIHLPQSDLVEEKVFRALVERKKPRDFYDLYFIMRKGMLSLEQKQKLFKIKSNIISQAKEIDFRGELGVFLPADQQAIIRDFARVIELELNRQLANNLS